MPDLIQTYQDAMRRLDAATGKAERIASIVSQAGEKLKNDGWKRFIVRGGSAQGVYPPAIAGEALTPGIDAQHWPSASDLHEALTRWHAAKGEAHSAWNSIPVHQRIGLQAPPS